jgi:putative heme d1 biosynthesis radical SAM protein NirJ1|tara:strand:+ start:398 stop:1582 length:1185 start_codon:yes stop_codon:yes gene_type:complete
MIGFSKLLCKKYSQGDALRYGRDSAKLPHDLLQFSLDKKPIVVWNTTRKCNLRCKHCYADASNREFSGELSVKESTTMIDDLAAFKVPVLLFSGGEPILRENLFELIKYAGNKGLRTVISTNGTLITPKIAQKIKDAGVSYVGVSIDGLESTNDKFRGVNGAFEDSLEGIRNCNKIGVKSGLRFTINKNNYRDLPDIFDLIDEEKVKRACFYHLVYSGRGNKMMEEDLDTKTAREVVDLILDKTLDLFCDANNTEILTVDNHADAVYLYLVLKEEQPERAEEVYNLLRWNGGNNSGIAIGNIDNLGNVHADQFWWNYSFGNIKERKFSDIWTDTSDPLMAGLKNRKHLLKGRCSVCKFLEICNGNFRVRAEAMYGDVWASDPACYLTDEEIGIV